MGYFEARARIDALHTRALRGAGKGRAWSREELDSFVADVLTTSPSSEPARREYQSQMSLAVPITDRPDYFLAVGLANASHHVRREVAKRKQNGREC